MLQDVFLFSGTVKSNIKLKDDNISDETVKEAVKYVNADYIIDKLENGYDTIVRKEVITSQQENAQLLSFCACYCT